MSIFQEIKLIPLWISMLFKIIMVNHKYKIEVINANWIIPSGLLSTLACLNTPVIITVRGSDINLFTKNSLHRKLIKFTLNRAHKIITLSNSLKDATRKIVINSTTIVVINGGVNTRKFYPINKELVRTKLNIDNNFHVIYIGTFINIKRVDVLVNICNILDKKYGKIKLLLVGIGPNKNHIMQLANKLNYSQLIFTGYIPHDNIPLYLNASNVLVLPSELEGLPDCVQEAMACGIPVIANNTGGLSELIKHGINGYLTNSGDEIAEYLTLLINNNELAKNIGKNARKFAVQKLSIKVAVNKTEKIYKSVIST